MLAPGWQPEVTEAGRLAWASLADAPVDAELVLLGLDTDGVADLARAGVRASFVDDAGKRALLAEIDDYVKATV